MKYICCFLLVICSACVSIPKEASELSEELGIQLLELEQAHLNLVQAFFENKRKKVRIFIDQTWLPLFAQNFFNQSHIDQVWQQVVVSDNTEDRMEFIVRVAPEIYHQTNKKYEELITPLNRLEQELTQVIRTKYAESRYINQSLTAFLHSASKIDENRQRYLDRINLTKDETSQIIDHTEQLTDTLVQYAGDIEQLEEQFNQFTDKINKLLSNF